MFAALVLAAFPLAAAGDEAEDAFNSLYGAEYKKTLASRDTGDDIALAAQLLAAARAKGTLAPLATVLCEKAYELGMKAPAGCETAAEAMELAAEKAPDKKAVCLEKIVAVRQKQYEAAKGLDKTNAGEVYVEAVLVAADAKGEAGEAAEASVMLKKAMTIATALKSDRKGEIQVRIDRFAARMRAERQAADLKAKLAANPQDAAARKELVRLCLIEMDDPAQAATFVDESSEESMRKYVPAVSKGVDAAPEVACMELGEWYRGLAESASTLFKEPLMRRARAYYARFLNLHAAEDIQRNQATLALKKADEALARLAPRGTGVIGPGRWIDLLGQTDPEKDTVAGKWQLKDGVLSMAPGDRGRIRLPCVPLGSYQLSLKFLRAAGDHEIVVYLPVGATGVTLIFDRWGFDQTLLANAPGGSARAGAFRLVNGKEYSLDIRVLVSGDQADIAVQLDGKPIINWTGRQSALAINDEWRIADWKGFGLAASPTNVSFNAVRVRMPTGTAKLLRQP
jgi:hypothetical protein